MFDVAAVRRDFPILAQTVRDGMPLAYLDSAATSQKPLAVLDAERDFLLTANASVHRGSHALAERATLQYEAARRTIADFVGAEPDQFVFVRNATEAINLVAYAFENATAEAARSQRDADPRFVLTPGDEILLSEMEHHSNLVPWQQLAKRTGAKLRFIPLTADGRLELAEIGQLVNRRTRIVSLVVQSNILGTINPVAEIFELARKVNAVTLADACQAVPHGNVSFSELGADFLAFSGHKMLGPTGIGGLVGDPELLAAMPPFLSGGSMIETVHLESSTWAPAPQKFEAGTPNVAQAIGLAAAADYLRQHDLGAIRAHSAELTGAALAGLQDIPGVSIVGPTSNVDRGAAISFVVDAVHPHDVAQVLDARGIAVRAGHHCAWPVCRRYGVPATTRASFYLYNTPAEVDELIAGVRATREFFGVA